MLEIEPRAKAILAASTGGHLEQLVRLSKSFDFVSPPTWVTFDNSQSRALLEGQDVVFLPYIAPRDWLGVMKALPRVRKLMADARYDLAVSTGAAIAGAVLPMAVVAGKRAVYIESVSRFDGPSLTGRVLRVWPRVETYTQHGHWASEGWQLTRSVLADYASTEVAQGTIGPLKIFVTLGTIKPFRFDALVDKLEAVLDKECEVRWQLGETVRSVEHGTSVLSMSSSEFDECVRWSDVVVSHAGVGSAMRIMDLGRMPVLVPRRSVRGEHIDDHQEQVARVLGEKGLVEAVEAPQLSMEVLRLVASRRVVGPGANEGVL